MSNKITFFLMNYKGLYVLEKFIERFGSQSVAQVISSRDQGLIDDSYEEIKDICLNKNIDFLNRNNFTAIKTKYAIAIGWRWLIHTDKQLIILHDSLLPKYRGFSPLVAALITGVNRIGVTALFASPKYDEGDIIQQESISVDYPIKIYEAIQAITPLYYKIIESVYTTIAAGEEIPGFAQNESHATYSLWRDEDDYRIDWNKSAEYIKRFIDSIGKPYKGASSLVGGKNVRILDAEVVSDVQIENRDTGKVVFIQKGFPVVVCKEGLLKIKDAYFDDSGETILPLSRFRSRFT